jgi:site-specific DNA-methyltransferase (adenine-specific)
VDTDLRLGRWQDVLGDVECDALITDPPYGARTHAGQRHRRSDGHETIATCDVQCNPLPYDGWEPSDVSAFVSSWAPRVRGWFCAMTSHDLVPHYIAAMEAAGRYVFAPIACVQHAMNVRLAGDGPSNWTVWLVVSRPRSMRAWGTLPGAYVGSPFDPGENTMTAAKRAIPGGKPVWIMRSIVRDYSRPGDLVCDPCAGAGTTLLAARMEGRRSVGAEMDPDTYDKARRRLADMPLGTERQPALFDGLDR